MRSPLLTITARKEGRSATPADTKEPPLHIAIFSDTFYYQQNLLEEPVGDLTYRSE